jgi:hypothetical protein
VGWPSRHASIRGLPAMPTWPSEWLTRPGRGVSRARPRVVRAIKQEATQRLASVRVAMPDETASGIVADLSFVSSGIEPEIVQAADMLEVMPGLRMSWRASHSSSPRRSWRAMTELMLAPCVLKDHLQVSDRSAIRQRPIVSGEETFMTPWTWIVVLIVFACPGVLAAQPKRDIINNNTLNHGSTIRDLLQTLDKVATEHSGVSDELKRLRGTFGIVFVPGILGSTLDSKSKGNLWGSGIPKPDDLRLDPSLVNEKERSDVTTGLALSLAGVSLYDIAFQKIRASAATLGIPAERIAACGYDWRRDIRWGADELNECIATHPNLRDVTALIIIAHSMGGVVTWQWHATHASDGWTHGKRIVAVAALGSPLEGSCEMLRRGTSSRWRTRSCATTRSGSGGGARSPE